MLKTLIVEDSCIYRDLLCELLIEQYPDIIIATSGDGSNLMALIDEFRPNLVFMDIRLPGANGLELTRSLVEAHPELPVVVLTSYSDEDYRLAALAAGAYKFIPKDELDDDKVANLLNAVVASRHLKNCEGRVVSAGRTKLISEKTRKSSSASVSTESGDGSTENADRPTIHIIH